ncbi:MAG: sigma factor-like helix-turn-helix DNA-binding protein [Patescibacteria group bacterium]
MDIPKNKSQAKIENTTQTEQIHQNPDIATFLSARNPFGRLTKFSKVFESELAKIEINKIEYNLKKFDERLEQLMPRIYALETTKDGKIDFKNITNRQLTWSEINKYCTQISNNWENTSDEEFDYFCNTVDEYETNLETYPVNRFTIFTLISKALSHNILVKEMIRQVAEIQHSLDIIFAQTKSEYKPQSKPKKTKSLHKAESKDATKKKQKHNLQEEQTKIEVSETTQEAAELVNNDQNQEEQEQEQNQPDYKKENQLIIRKVVNIAESLKPKIEALEQLEIENQHSATQSWLSGEYGIKKFGYYKDLVSNPRLHPEHLRLEEQLLILKTRLSKEDDELKKATLTLEIIEMQEQLDQLVIDIRKSAAGILVEIRKLNKVFDELIILNQKLAYTILKRYFFTDIDVHFAKYKSSKPEDVFLKNTTVTIGELLNNTNYALIETALKLESSNRDSFAGLAYFFIRNAVSRIFKTEGYRYRIPDEKKSTYKKIVELQNNLRRQYPDISTYELELKLLEQVREQLGIEMTLEKLHEYRRYFLKVITYDEAYKPAERVYIDEPIEYTTVVDNIKSDYISPDKYAEDQDLIGLITEYFQEFSERTKSIMYSIYYKNKSYAETGKDHDLSPARIKQIHDKSKRKLIRDHRKRLDLKEYFNDL